MDQIFSFTSYGIYAALALLLGIICACAYVLHARKCSTDVLLTFGVVTVPCVWFFSRLVFGLPDFSWCLMKSTFQVSN